MSPKEKDNLSKAAAEEKDQTETLIPNGELKWSKEDELSKGSSTVSKQKQDVISQDQQKTNQEDREIDDSKKDKNGRGKSRSKTKKAKSKARDKKKLSQKSGLNDSQNAKTKDGAIAKDNDRESDPNKQYSIEDTLGPIDFKEYPMETDEITNEEQENHRSGNPAQSPENKGDQSTADLEKTKIRSKSGQSGTKHRKKEEATEKKAEAKQETSTSFVFSQANDDSSKKPKQAKSDRQKRRTRESVEDTKTENRPFWRWSVKLVWLPVTLFVALVIGLVVGHTTIGGQPFSNIFNVDMWIHLYKLIFTK